ncbi:hypothetical protein KHS38_12030 [Mucilaginibacter sp. Bleaf8]|uniref:hypothetical protein n=1 Tax=Mucilaginibacter sp. Bleaf8 TaxID=2834430 RepID=UPI001BCFD5B7|nr:hypothetical protein [Mucilaginibacter sp. Bleaf8]MBS7565133.1 hypothetical protein [Mucilaginibacter sp. Bleaf8]
MSKISPPNVAMILNWAKRQFPEPNVVVSNYEPNTGADGILVEFDELDVTQAYELQELRRLAECHVSIGSTDNLDKVVFDMLFPSMQR